MKQRQRLKEIVEYLDKHQELSVQEACTIFDASPATIRRDFTVLIKNDQVDKVWGGVARATNRDKSVSSTPVSFRKTLYLEEKKLIAEKASSFIEDGDVIIIDGGTTTFHMTKFLANKPIRIITNSLLIAHQIDRDRSRKEGAEVFLTGGFVYPEASILVGPQAIANIKEYHAKWAFLSVGGIEDNQATNSNHLIVETERAIIQQSEKTIMLADHSKFGKKSMCKLCAIQEIDILVTDYHGENEPFVEEIRSCGVEVVEINGRG